MPFFPHKHSERHFIQRAGWLRAAVLGANDGIISTSSLMLGVAMAASTQQEILISGIAALTAGAMSMAAGEYVSVSSQADSEQSDLARERRELVENPEGEINELAGIYMKRGVAPELARQVALQMMEKDALEAHARDELGITEVTSARPLQAAVMSAVAFSSGAIFPILFTLSLPQEWLKLAVPGLSLLLLGVLGAVGAAAGGARQRKPVLRAVARVMAWGAAAMAFTALIGSIAGTTLL